MTARVHPIIKPYIYGRRKSLVRSFHSSKFRSHDVRFFLPAHLSLTFQKYFVFLRIMAILMFYYIRQILFSKINKCARLVTIKRTAVSVPKSQPNCNLLHRYLYSTSRLMLFRLMITPNSSVEQPLPLCYFYIFSLNLGNIHNFREKI